jgi:hypothetical protein
MAKDPAAAQELESDPETKRLTLAATLRSLSTSDDAA